MSAYWFGPIPVDLRDPHISLTSSPDAYGIRSGRISGLAHRDQIHQLSVLVNNPRRQVYLGEHKGVLERMWLDWPGMASPYSGLYLLSDFSVGDIEWRWAGDGLPDLKPLPFSMTCALVGHSSYRELGITRSARAKVNDYGYAAKAQVAASWWDEDPDGSAFVVSTGGTQFTRPYDPTSPHDSSVITPADVRRMTIYAGACTASVDNMKRVVIPALRLGTHFEGQEVPRWHTDRGGDVRAFDRSTGLEYHGEGHDFASTTDILITNGITRFWVGSRGLPPYLTVQSCYPDSWVDVGHLLLGGPGTLSGARVTELTPDRATVALQVRAAGTINVTLRRGDRKIDVGWDTRPPAGLPDRNVSWSGMPPCGRAVTALSAAGHFGNGLSVPAAGGTDVVPLWPANTPTDEWSQVFWYRATANATAAGVGYQTIYDTAGLRAVVLELDPVDDKIKLTVGGTTLASAVQSYTAGQDIAIGIRFSISEGLGLSVRSPAGVVTHVLDVAATDPGTALLYEAWAYLTNTTDWGDVDWGSGSWGGVSTFANGVITHHRIFDRFLSSAEMQALLTATDAVDNMPDPEGACVWHAPYGGHLLPLFSTQTAGLKYETTTALGVTRHPDLGGLTKGLAYLDAGGTRGVGALIATTEPNDDLADQKSQFGAEYEQQDWILT